ncbi:MAG: hypothetical protein V2J26_05960 [Pacificimonas sp.]|jgi:hypothetical protein|nr:hypothetical protein [Pacificimonas sp.]
MDWGSPLSIVLIIAVCGVIGFLNNWVRAKHGYELEDDWGGTSKAQKLQPDRKVELLTSENEALKGQVSRLEERLSVLERIATDPSDRLSKEIESLRKEERA